MTPSTYVTVYDKETGVGYFSYAGTVQEWLATGKYTTVKPSNAQASTQAVKAKLPTAGREANRENPIVSGGKGIDLEGAYVSGHEDGSLEPVDEKPVKPAPRRRSTTETDT